jgi:hypothetical protein
MVTAVETSYLKKGLGENTSVPISQEKSRLRIKNVIYNLPQ